MILDSFPTRSQSGLFAVSLGLLFSAVSSFAAFPYAVSTNGSGVITGGSWSGNGTVQPNVSAGTFAGTVGVNFIKEEFVRNFSNGTFTINPGNLHSNVAPEQRVPDPFGAAISLQLTGGTGDLYLVNSNPYDGGASLFNSLTLGGLAGVTEVRIKFTFNQPIAGRILNEQYQTPMTLSYAPMGAAIGAAEFGAGLTGADFDITATYSGIYSSLDGETFVAGLPGAALPYASAQWTNEHIAGTSSFTATGFSGEVTPPGSPSEHFLLVRGYNIDGIGNFNPATDTDNVYITELEVVIKADPGKTFAADTEFVFSMDGQSYANAQLVPEPSAVVMTLGGLAAMVTFFRRTRRTA